MWKFQFLLFVIVPLNPKRYSKQRKMLISIKYPWRRKCLSNRRSIIIKWEIEYFGTPHIALENIISKVAWPSLARSDPRNDFPRPMWSNSEETPHSIKEIWQNPQVSPSPSQRPPSIILSTVWPTKPIKHTRKPNKCSKK